MLQKTELPLSALLRRPDVEEITGLPRSSLYDLIAREQFPQPVKISVRSVAWRWADVQAWLQDPTGWAATNDNG